MKSQLAVRRDLLLLVVWLAVIFKLSTGAGSAIHTNSWVDALLFRFFPHWYAHLTWPVHDAIHYYLRKAAHVTEYAVLGVLMVRAFRHGRWAWRSVLLLAWAAASLYAASDETHQIFVAGRTPKVTDVLLDSAGAAVGVALTTWFLAWRLKSRQQRHEVGEG
nr:VanZ family protein [Armatimonadota bacterium]